VTEAEWLTCEDPDGLLDTPHCDDRRKRRLFGCACARAVLHYLNDSQVEKHLIAAEAFADGLINREELMAFRASLLEMRDHLDGHENLDRQRYAASAVMWACESRGPGFHDRRAASQAQFAVAGGAYTSMMAAEAIRQARMIRDIFGNPFRRVAFSPEWRTSTVIALATGVYESRDFSAMPILADALQDAGCGNADVLDHCRGDGTHVRGCWVVDAILGKE